MGGLAEGWEIGFEDVPKLGIDGLDCVVFGMDCSKPKLEEKRDGSGGR